MYLFTLQAVLYEANNVVLIENNNRYEQMFPVFYFRRVR